MKRYQKPTTNIPSTPEAPLEASESFDVVAELERCEEIVRRDIRNIMAEGARGKLSKSSSDDLVKYMKELREIADEQKDQIKKAKTEDLEKLK